jgi:predicted nucleotidyltransferase component of viral defense system
MIAEATFTSEHLKAIKENKRIDPFLLERNIYALGLVEALVQVGMPFIFKGGTSLMLLLKKPRRLSTDIDIIVEPGTDLKEYLHNAAKIFPFTEVNEQIRFGKNSISNSCMIHQLRASRSIYY